LRRFWKRCTDKEAEGRNRNAKLMGTGIKKAGMLKLIEKNDR